MIVLKIVFNVLPEKYLELEQTLLSMSSDLYKISGCKQADLWRDSRDESRLYKISSWENRTALDAYLQSDKFSALMGTKLLLRTPPSVTIDSVVSSEGMEAVTKVRSAPQRN
jgi:quinol monooxygenase YgiN